MPSSLAHAAAALTVAYAIAPRDSFSRVATLAAICAVAPDVDGLPRLLGADPAMLAGHRGVTHSIAGALCIAALMTMVAPRAVAADRGRIAACLLLAALSHGLLDAFTNYGTRQGVAFLAPFSDHRFNAPAQPLTGEFSDLLLCLALLITAWVFARARGLPFRIRRRQAPLELKLDHAAAFVEDAEPPGV